MNSSKTRAAAWVGVPWMIVAIVVVVSAIQHWDTSKRLQSTPADVLAELAVVKQELKLANTPTEVLAELEVVKTDYAKRFDTLGQELEQRTRDRFTAREAEKLEARLRAIETKVGIND